jgi:hypothetical protein
MKSSAGRIDGGRFCSAEPHPVAIPLRIEVMGKDKGEVRVRVRVRWG